MNKMLLSLGVAVAALSMSGCGRQISSSVYSDSSVGETSHTYRGIIVSKRMVEVAGSDKLQDNAAGGLLGGATGAVVGSAFGGGRGAVAGTVLGGVAGAVAGAYAQKSLETQQGTEYVIELTNGELKTVVQGPEPALGVGQKVLLMISSKGRSRVVIDAS